MKNEILEDIEALLEQVMGAPTKAEAKPLLKALEFKKDSIRNLYGTNASYKLSEAMSSAESAAGRVPNKDHHKLRARMHCSTLKNIISRCEQGQL